MKLGYILLITVVSTLLSSCAPSQFTKELWQNRYRENAKPLNLIPMYGYPHREKTAEQKQADKVFIQTVTASSGTKEKASYKLAGQAWLEISKGNNQNAMRRFNQAWLLNPNNYEPYWGFGTLLRDDGRPAKSIVHYEKALELIDNDKMKPRLLTATAEAYFTIGRKSSNSDESLKSFEKTHLLLSKAVQMNPKHGRAYKIWAFTHFEQGNYTKSWAMVKKSKNLGQQFNPKFINALSEKMPDPDTKRI